MSNDKTKADTTDVKKSIVNNAVSFVKGFISEVDIEGDIDGKNKDEGVECKSNINLSQGGYKLSLGVDNKNNETDFNIDLNKED